MSWSKTTVIVGFYPLFQLPQAEGWIRHVTGFIRILHAYRLSNAALVQVWPDELESFVDEVVTLDNVEYCDYNFLVSPASFDEHIGSWQPSSNLSCKIIKSAHKISDTQMPGAGITVALVDSGLTPHPYLPFTSFKQSIECTEQWADHVRGNVTVERGVRRIADLESAKSLPLSGYSTETDRDDFITGAQQQIGKIKSELSQAWLQQAVQWYQSNLQIVRAGSHGGPPIPAYPVALNGFCGQIRRISLLSRNFIDNNLCVDDTYGHGTAMAGILSGRSPLNHVESEVEKKRVISKYEIDTLGIAPNAELMILKCYDKHRVEASDLDAVIRALEYAEENGVDIVYFGLAFKGVGLPFKAAITLDRTIQALRIRNIPVVCPAGNNSGSELEFPAWCKDAIAITAVAVDRRGQLHFAPYSNQAGVGEEVLFTAYGGDDDFGCLTTDLYFGFKEVKGTSVASAIATGIFTRYLAAKYSSLRQKEYESAMFSMLRAGHPPTLQCLQSSANIKIDDLISEARIKADHTTFSGSPPSPRFGYGLLRQFLP
jgi:hypothetical protein